MAESSEVSQSPRRTGVWVVIAVLAALAPAFAVLNRREPALHAIDVDTAFEHPERLAGRFRIEGFVVPGSCIDYQSPCEHQFQIHGTKHVLNVRYPHCEMPLVEDLGTDVWIAVEGFVAVNRAEVVATTLWAKSDGVDRSTPRPLRRICPEPHAAPSL